MSVIQEPGGNGGVDRIFAALTDETRRRIVRILDQHAGALSEGELAERLVARGPDGEGDDSAASVERVQVRVRHLHLPKLEESGLLAWDAEERTVARTDHHAYRTRDLERLVDADERGESAVAALADDHRRVVAAIVESERSPTKRADLARAVASRERDGTPSAATVRDVETRLHHRHLPRLEAAGLVEYDTDAETVVPGDRLDDLTTLLPSGR